MALQTGKTLNDPGRWRSNTPEIYFKSTEEMLQLFQRLARGRGQHPAHRRHGGLRAGAGQAAAAEVPPARRASPTPDAYLEHLAREGLRRRYGTITPELEERLDYELGVIRQTGYAGYFLIVWDFIDAARRMNIPVGPGRGSAAGSLVCYCIGITDIDPIRHQLLFERFLNPERISMPDIDVDFCFEKRGRDHRVRGATSTGARTSRRSSPSAPWPPARCSRTWRGCWSSRFAESDRISKLVPEEIGITLQRAIDEAPGLKEVAPRVASSTPSCCATPWCSRASTATPASTPPAC